MSAILPSNVLSCDIITVTYYMDETEGHVCRRYEDTEDPKNQDDLDKYIWENYYSNGNILGEYIEFVFIRQRNKGTLYLEYSKLYGKIYAITFSVLFDREGIGLDFSGDDCGDDCGFIYGDSDEFHEIMQFILYSMERGMNIDHVLIRNYDRKNDIDKTRFLLAYLCYKNIINVRINGSRNAYGEIVKRLRTYLEKEMLNLDKYYTDVFRHTALKGLDGVVSIIKTYIMGHLDIGRVIFDELM